MFRIEKWSDKLELTEFYKTAAAKGFENNSTQHRLVNCFDNEREKQVWILYYNDVAIGSVAAHSFDEMGVNSYRIAARTCVFTDHIGGAYGNALRTISVITKQQNPTAQFLIPACIEWAPINAKLYITSNENLIGTQKRVHNIFGPAMERIGVMERVTNMLYRGSIQTVWRVNPTKFNQELSRYPRWVRDQ